MRSLVEFDRHIARLKKARAAKGVKVKAKPAALRVVHAAA